MSQKHLFELPFERHIISTFVYNISFVSVERTHLCQNGITFWMEKTKMRIVCSRTDWSSNLSELEHNATTETIIIYDMVTLMSAFPTSFWKFGFYYCVLIYFINKNATHKGSLHRSAWKTEKMCQGLYYKQTR